MRGSATAILAAVMVLGACHKAPKGHPAPADVEQPATVPVNQAATAIPPPATGPDAKTPLAEPKGPIDPKSVEAAGQVVQHYGALIERSRWLKAEKLWGDIEAARAFATALAGQFHEVHLEIGDLGGTEGAAGSIYTNVPVAFYGKTKPGKPIRRKAEIILRRVNDVPGATEKQLRWHIERIEWK